MLLKVFTALGAVALGASGFWGFLTIAVPTLPAPAPKEKVQLTLPMHDVKSPVAMAMPWPPVSPVMQPASAVRPVAQSALQAEPSPQLPATLAAARSLMPPGGPQAPQTVAEASASDDRSYDPLGDERAQPIASPVRAPIGEAKPRSVVSQFRAPKCTRNKSYNASTRSYRGYDGVVHSCNR